VAWPINKSSPHSETASWAIKVWGLRMSPNHLKGKGVVCCTSSSTVAVLVPAFRQAGISLCFWLTVQAVAVKQQQQEQDEPGSIPSVWPCHVASMLWPGAEVVWLLLLDVAATWMNVWGPLRKLCHKSDVGSPIKRAFAQPVGSWLWHVLC